MWYKLNHCSIWWNQSRVYKKELNFVFLPTLLADSLLLVAFGWFDGKSKCNVTIIINQLPNARQIIWGINEINVCLLIPRYNVQMYLSRSCRIFIFIVIILVHKYYINNTLIWITLHCTKYNQKLLTKQKVSWPSISCVVRTKVFCHLRYIKIRNTAIETRTTYVAGNSLVPCEIIFKLRKGNFFTDSKKLREKCNNFYSL